MKYTGERMVPELVNPRNGLLKEHIARYEFAAKTARGRILDLGCGVGYGTEILLDSQEADEISQVVGVDIDAESIEYARDMYGYRRADFRVADIRDATLPAQLGQFDTIICFEVIEHMKEEAAVISNIIRMLKPKGKLIISTPFGKGKGKPCSCPYHVHQYTENEFLEMLQTYFDVDLYVQRDTLIEKRRIGMKYYLMVACCHLRVQANEMERRG
ncbi:MAG: class I SAM-dependent methyltransferase [Bacillota bacterium]|nr:class I SAM-dependent methyltransferase [Bacillota bacterium]MDW7676929.1 class I SAM-dependent methyltransferase [Bacillota bacterium]